MKKIIRLSESQLTEIIKRVISEAGTSTSIPAKGPGPSGTKCKDPYYVTTYTSSSPNPVYLCNGANGWYNCGTDAGGATLCCCGKASPTK